MIAARDGGGNPEMNARLALAIDKAKAENMPRDNMERAIKRGTGEIASADYTEMTYEGYAPGGIAVFVDCLTDNTNRTVADVRHLFSKFGGNLGNSGSVAFQFNRKGQFVIQANGLDEDDLFMIVADAGAEDLSREDDTFIVLCEVEHFGAVQNALSEAEISTLEAELIRIPTTTTALPPEQAQTVIRMVEALEDLQDVQTVSTTLELDDATLASL